MIVYAETKREFMEQVRDNRIFEIIHDAMKRNLHKDVGRSEQFSWKNSLNYMRNVLDDHDIPDNAGVAIEYNIPQTAKRVDFLISGYDRNRSKNVIIIELKQWDSARLTHKDAHVNIGYDVLHPSYQAWTYKTLFEDYNSAIQENKISLQACAYLHNYHENRQSPVISHPFYNQYIAEAPVFFREDSHKLRRFIKQFIRFGDNKEMLYEIEQGKIKPSKNLANSLAGMMIGKPEFILIDDQKEVYETALDLADQAKDTDKRVLIIKGGPGTGKSVVAINLMVELTQRNYLVQYVTSNGAPRAVYESKLSGTMHKSRISNLFKGATIYQNINENEFDVLLVDEAHRLSSRNLLNTYKGNQVADLIRASKLTIFFLDESQKVLIEDIGNEEEIAEQAKKHSASITTMDLLSQFRCNGSDGYLAWLDNTLGIASTANTTLDGIDYDYRVMDSPQELHELIREKNSNYNAESGSRVVAGYCWKWKSKKNPADMDIVIGNYQACWNNPAVGSLWAIDENTIDEIGCIHTVQGLEFDYIGVIIGEDLVVRNGVVVTQPDKRDSVDANKTLRGFKTIIKSKDLETVENVKSKADAIIKNTYKVLMTRGKRGCYVYCCDPELRDYLLERISNRQMYGLSDSIGSKVADTTSPEYEISDIKKDK